MKDRQPRLIVVDDEPGMLGLIERAVRPSGYDVSVYTSAREALGRLETEPADVAIVDLRMPEIGGLDLLRQMLPTRIQRFEE